MCIELRTHNQKTYDNILEMWKEKNRVASIQPTGSGKSFLILKCAEYFAEDKKVVLAPSTYILEQMEKNATGIKCIKYITYAKLQNMSDEELSELNPSFIAIDEFHRCGAEEWGNGVKRLLDMYQDAKVLGTSATPIRYLDNARDMAEELFKGNVACNMALPQAIIEGILPMPKYVTALYTFKEEANNMIEKVNKSRNSDEEKEILIKDIKKLKQKLDKSKGIPKIFQKHITNENGRYIIFCKNKEHLDEMKETVYDWFKKYFKLNKINNKINTYEVYSDLANQDKQLDMFMKDDSENTIKLLFSINKLNEGLHISNLDGVILLRPTVSPIIYYQQIGRAIDAGRKDQTLILDLVNNFSSVKTCTLKNDLEEEAVELCNHRGITGEEKEEFISKFNIFDESHDVIDLFNDIENSLINNWEFYYNLLKEYYNTNGNCNVPRYVNGKISRLYEWVIDIRRRQSNISKERLSQLKELNFSFDPYYEAWLNCYELLKKYYEKEGNTEVDRSYIINGIKLGSWTQNMRTRYRTGDLSDEQIKLLNDIGFRLESNFYDKKWNEYYELLKQYKKREGNCNVPSRHIENGVKLGSWLVNQKNNYRNVSGKRTLKKEYVDKLKEIGVVFDIVGTQSKKIRVLKDSKVVGVYDSAKFIEDHSIKLLNIPLDSKSIYAVCLNKRKTYKGYVFEYA